MSSKCFSFFPIVKIFKNYRLAILLMVAFLVRFYHLDWGEGLFFHPDENNMVRSISQMNFPDLNPHFFAYGQFPLYLTYFTGILMSGLRGELSFTVSSFEAVYILRFWSAIFSLATVVVGYKLTTILFANKNQKCIYPALLALTPGLIQSAHFGTTESIMAFVFILLTYYCLKIYKEELSGKYFLVTGLISGIGLATKMSSAVYIFPLLLITAIFTIARSEKRSIQLKNFLALLIVAGLFFAIFCPFYFISWQEAASTIGYESKVAAGKVAVFYTRQFTGTKPIIFQLAKVFPWALGLPMFFLFLAGFVNGAGRLFFKKIKPSRELIVVLIGPVSWFIFNGFLYAKWTRFMTPVLPFLVLLAAWFVSLIDKKKIKTIFLLVSFSPGLIFLKVYNTDIRLSSTDWMNKNLPAGSVILSEGGNVVDLPVKNLNLFKVSNFDFYSLEDSLKNKDRLEGLIDEADYILIPSRRVFANLHQEDAYPQTASYYQRLFTGELGFVKYKQFATLNVWEELLLGSDLTSEETWTVFDRPTIRLYKRESI